MADKKIKHMLLRAILDDDFRSKLPAELSSALDVLNLPDSETSRSADLDMEVVYALMSELHLTIVREIQTNQDYPLLFT